MPRLPPVLMDCTFYLYPSVESATAGKGYGGTGFIVGVSSEMHPGKVVYLYGVTNWHVAVRDGCSCVRLHRRDGTHQIFDAGPEEWQFLAGGADVAVAPLPLNSEQHRFAFISTDAFATHDVLTKHSIGIGEDAFMLGRFIDHDGGEKNAPAARFGHISLMPDGPIRQPTGAMQESYCIDMHSRTGYSGSPAFVYRTPGNDFTSYDINLTDRFLYLLGIHWGQFPELWELASTPKSIAPSKESLLIEGGYVKGLSGMTCVAPAWRIMEVLDLPTFKEQRRVGDRQWKEKLEVAPPTTKSASATP